MSVDADLVAEKILDEMSRARRWYHIEKAWDALLNIRRISDSIRKEQEQQETCSGQSKEPDA